MLFSAVVFALLIIKFTCDSLDFIHNKERLFVAQMDFIALGLPVTLIH